MRLHSDVHQGLNHGLRISLVRQGAAVPREDGCVCGWIILIIVYYFITIP